MDGDIVAVLGDLTRSVGMWAVFAWLFVQERKAHQETRRLHNDDLREIAGLRHSLPLSPPAPSPTAEAKGD